MRPRHSQNKIKVLFKFLVGQPGYIVYNYTKTFKDTCCLTSIERRCAMNETKLNVVLLAYPPNPEKIITHAARTCYSADTIADLEKKVEIGAEKRLDFIKILIESGHLSPIEHASYTFGIEGISRACSHQLVRHRLASYSQKSQRYFNEIQFEYIVPETIKNAGLENEFKSVMEFLQNKYNELKKAGIPSEDARFILPNACETKLVVTMNARELLNVFNQRCCNKAQWEIRSLAKEMYKLVLPTTPAVFKYTGPNCVIDRCKESHPCGKINEVIKEFVLLKESYTKND